MIKSIIWDWNGTLLNDVDYNVNVVNIILKRRGIKAITKDEYRMLKKVPIKQFYIDIGINAANDNVFSEIIKEYWTAYNDGYTRLELNRNAENILRRTQKDGIRNYLLSLTNNKELINQIDFFGIKDYFEKITGSDDSEARNKTDKAKELIEKEKLNAKETLFIGDVINDYEVAERFGMECILYAKGHQKIDRDKKYTIIENLDEIIRACFKTNRVLKQAQVSIKSEERMAGHIKLPVAVHLFLIKDKNILLLRRYNTGYEDGNYSVIAGHIDGKEHVYDAMIREAKEEAGITIAREDLEIIQVMHRRTAEEERIDYFFLCEEWEGEIKNIEPHKCDKLSWCSLENLPQNTIGYINAAIENYQDEIRFSIFGW